MGPFIGIIGNSYTILITIIVVGPDTITNPSNIATINSKPTTSISDYSLAINRTSTSRDRATWFKPDRDGALSPSYKIRANNTSSDLVVSAIKGNCATTDTGGISHTSAVGVTGGAVVVFNGNIINCCSISNSAGAIKWPHAGSISHHFFGDVVFGVVFNRTRSTLYTVLVIAITFIFLDDRQAGSRTHINSIRIGSNGRRIFGNSQTGNLVSPCSSA